MDESFLASDKDVSASNEAGVDILLLKEVA